jgi:hypothetical protein
VIDRFAIPWAGKPTTTATRARLLWDRENLYFLAEMQDADIYAEVQEHDGRTWQDDVFELFFKPAEDKPGYYEFQVNAAGTMLDMFLPQRGDGGYERYERRRVPHGRARGGARLTAGRIGIALGWWKDASRGGTSFGPAAARRPMNAGSSRCAATITGLILHNRNYPPRRR